MPIVAVVLLLLELAGCWLSGNIEYHRGFKEGTQAQQVELDTARAENQRVMDVAIDRSRQLDSALAMQEIYRKAYLKLALATDRPPELDPHVQDHADVDNLRLGNMLFQDRRLMFHDLREHVPLEPPRNQP